MKQARTWAYNLLRKSEKVFKTDMVYVAKGGFWLGFGQVASIIFSLVLSVIFANAVSKDIYGSYKFVIASVSILSTLTLTGMGTAITQGVAKGKEGILRDAIKTTLRWGYIILGGSSLAAVWYISHGNLILGISMITGGIAMLIINSFGLYGNYLVGKRDFKSNIIYNTIAQAIITIAVIVSILVVKKVLVTVFAYFLTYALTTYIFYRITIKKNKINNVSDPSLLRYSKHVSIMNFFGTLASQLDMLLIFHYLGAVELAIFSFAKAMPEQIRGMFKNLFGLALPKFAGIPEDKLKKSISSRFLQLTAIAAAFIVIYIFAAPHIFNLLFPKYLEAVPYSQIFVLGLITIPGISLFSTYFQLKKVTRIVYKINITSNIATIFITYPLIFKFGLMGAVIANGLSWLALLVITSYYFFNENSSEDTVVREMIQH